MGNLTGEDCKQIRSILIDYEHHLRAYSEGSATVREDNLARIKAAQLELTELIEAGNETDRLVSPKQDIVAAFGMMVRHYEAVIHCLRGEYQGSEYAAFALVLNFARAQRDQAMHWFERLDKARSGPTPR